MKKKILIICSAIIILVATSLLYISKCVAYEIVDGVVHIEETQQYVSTDFTCKGSGDYKLPIKYENQFEDGDAVTCKILVCSMSDLTYYKLIDVSNIFDVSNIWKKSNIEKLEGLYLNGGKVISWEDDGKMARIMLPDGTDYVTNISYVSDEVLESYEPLGRIYGN